MKENSTPEEVTFRYHPAPLQTGAFSDELKEDEDNKCGCCGRNLSVYYSGPFVNSTGALEVKLCPSCIASGAAAEKFDGLFHDPQQTEAGVSDWTKLDELVNRTPGFVGLSGSYWRSHCGDYCAYLGCYSGEQLEEMGVLEEVLRDPTLDDAIRAKIPEGIGAIDWDRLFEDFFTGDSHGGLDLEAIEGEGAIEEAMSRIIDETQAYVRSLDGKVQCRLFRCLKCGKHLVWADEFKASDVLGDDEEGHVG